ncbi:MAG: metallophosphoesterase family protein [Fibrobacterota bacterium]
MISLGIIADTHGRLNNVNLNGLFPENTAVITLGDISPSEFGIIEDVYGIFAAVKGNCDAGSSLPGTRTVQADGIRIFMSHFIPRVMIPSREISLEKGYDVVLFGHHHIRYQKIREGVLFVNPGSYGLPKDNKGPSAACMHIADGTVNVEFLNVRL